MADALEAEISRHVSQGYRVVSRTPDAAQLLKPKSFDRMEGILLGVVCLALALLAGGLGILVAVLLVVGDLVWYAAKRDTAVYLSLDANGQVSRRKN